LVWSYILDYENSRNPFYERREQISKWRNYAQDDIEASTELIEIANRITAIGIKKTDSLHIACAIMANSDYFLTTDDGIIKKSRSIDDVKITDPIGFIKEVMQ
jgi:predicted nucleic acid-binding protein